MLNHPEVIIEMQFFASISILNISGMHIGEKDQSENSYSSSKLFLIVYLIVHIVSYISYLYKKRDLKLNGKPDKNGVLTGSKE